MPHSHHSHLCTPASAHGIGRDSILHLHAMNRSINFSDQNKLRWRPMLRVIQPNRLDPTRQPNHTFLLICLTKLLLVFYVIKSRWRATLILRLSPYSILITVRPSLSLATLTIETWFRRWWRWFIAIHLILWWHVRRRHRTTHQLAHLKQLRCQKCFFVKQFFLFHLSLCSDDRLSIEEFSLICRALFRNDQGHIYVVEPVQMQQMFGVFDKNVDGFIDRDEFKFCWNYWIKTVSACWHNPEIAIGYLTTSSCPHPLISASQSNQPTPTSLQSSAFTSIDIIFLDITDR